MALLCGLSLVVLAVAGLQASPPPTGIAVLRDATRGEPAADWRPTADYLTRVVRGRSFTIVPLAHDEVDDALASDRVGFAITDPASYLELEARHGATRLLTTRTRWNDVATRRYGGVVVVRSGSTIEELRDLRGRSLTAVGPQSFGGWLTARRELEAAGVDPDDLQRLVFAGSPTGSLLAVREGRADAGTARTGVLERLVAAGAIAGDELRVLAERPPTPDFPYVRSTELYPEWPIAALARTPPELARAVVVALLGLPAGAPESAAAGIDGWSIPAGDAPVRAAVAALRAPASPARDPGWPAAWTYAALGLAALGLLVVAARRGRRQLQRARRFQAELEQEIALRRRAEDELRRAARVADDLFNLSPCGMHALDADGVFLEVNDPELALLGYDRDDLVGKRKFSDLLTPASRQRFAREFPAFKQRGHVEDLEFDLVRKDGSAVPVLLSATAVFDELGHFVRTRSVVFASRERTLDESSLQRQYESLEERVRERTMELTAVIGTLQEEIRSRERAEVLLQQAEQRALAIVAAVEDGILTVDEDGFVESLNAAAERMFGWTEAQVVGRHMTALIRDGEDDYPTPEAVGRRRDGTAFPVEVTQSEMLVGGRRVYLRVLRDLTESKQAAERLRELADELRRNEVMAAIGSLVAGFAHEARNPLFGISAVVDALCARLGESHDYHEHVALLRRDVRRLSDLTHDLLEFGKPAPATLEPGELATVLQEAIAECRMLAQEKAVQVAAELPDASCRVERNDRLVRAFQNLLQNAIQFAPPNSVVRLDTTRLDDGAWVECRIADRGPGLQEEDLPRLFEPFFSRRRGGTGLGLAIVRRIVEEHRGTIAAGNAPGGGAAISVRLPIAA